MMLERIWSVATKEFRQIGRDRQTLGVLIFVPAFMLVMYGYALDLDVNNLSTGIYNGDHGPESRRLLGSMFQDGQNDFFERSYDVESAAAVDSLLRAGDIQVGLVIPPDFGEELKNSGTANVQVLIDGVNSLTASTALGYVSAAFYAFNQSRGRTAVQPSGAGPPPVEYRSRVWYNPELKSVWFLIPGLIAFLVMIITVVATALSIVREREQGSMEQLVLSSLRPGELVAGKLLPYGFITVVSTAFVVIASYGFFEVPIRGSLTLLTGGTLLYLLGALGMGLVISSVVRTQEVAFLIAAISTLLPTFVLSGFVFPISNMPGIIQAVTYLVPARYYLVVLRSVMLKAGGIVAIWDQLLFLVGFAVLMLAGGTLRLHRMMR